jgi:hypothetical protein
MQLEFRRTDEHLRLEADTAYIACAAVCITRWRAAMCALNLPKILGGLCLGTTSLTEE